MGALELFLNSFLNYCCTQNIYTANDVCLKKSLWNILQVSLEWWMVRQHKMFGECCLHFVYIS